jgi:hypothetical protein
MFALHCISIQESVMGFQPYGKDRRCRCCEHWGGDVPGTGHAVCLRFTHKQIQTFGKRGCAFWVRAIGIDENRRRRGARQTMRSRYRSVGRAGRGCRGVA